MNSPDPNNARGAVIRNITRRYYLLWWFYAFGGGFVFGVYPLFLRSRGLTELETNSVLATYFLITFLTDVPTGAFADALSRRTAFIFGCVLRTFSFGMYFFAHHYLLFLVAESIDAIGTTFGNGAIDAWAVDALDTAGFTGVKDRIFSRMSQLTTTGWLLSAMVGSYVASLDIAWPWLLGSAGYLTTLFVGATLMRGGPERVATRPAMRALITEVGSRTRSGLREGFRNRAVLLLALASAVQVGSWAPYFMEWPQYFHENLGVAIWMIGWLYCFFSIGRLTGAELIARFQPGGARRATLLTGLALGTGSMLLGAALVGQLRITLAMLFIMNMCSGAMQPVSQSWINEHLAARNRATLLSFQSTFATFGGALGLLICGWIADRHGLLTAWAVAGGIGLCPAIFYWMLRGEKLPAQETPAPAGNLHLRETEARSAVGDA
ncbi:MAG TPA: MFS transporter [Candidatus Binataceae bacterium]|nr:MFS transporter [Candidatus Binataceae bacterium]